MSGLLRRGGAREDRRQGAEKLPLPKKVDDEEPIIEDPEKKKIGKNDSAPNDSLNSHYQRVSLKTTESIVAAGRKALEKRPTVTSVPPPGTSFESRSLAAIWKNTMSAPSEVNPISADEPARLPQTVIGGEPAAVAVQKTPIQGRIISETVVTPAMRIAPEPAMPRQPVKSRTFFSRVFDKTSTPKPTPPTPDLPERVSPVESATVAPVTLPAAVMAQPTPTLIPPPAPTPAPVVPVVNRPTEVSLPPITDSKQVPALAPVSAPKVTLISPIVPAASVKEPVKLTPPKIETTVPAIKPTETSTPVRTPISMITETSAPVPVSASKTTETSTPVRAPITMTMETSTPVRAPAAIPTTDPVGAPASQAATTVPFAAPASQPRWVAVVRPSAPPMAKDELLKLFRESVAPSRREWAAEQLGLVTGAGSDDRVVQAMLAGANSDPAPMVRVACLNSIHQLGILDYQLGGILQRLKGDSDLRVKQTAHTVDRWLQDEVARCVNRPATKVRDHPLV